MDSCVECWANSEENTKCKNKKKRKGRGLCNDQVRGVGQLHAEYTATFIICKSNYVYFYRDKKVNAV